MATLRAELREHVRLTHQMAAQYRDLEGNTWEAASVDVSPGGAFFRTSNPPRPGSKIPLTLWPDLSTEEPVEALFEVRWTMDGGGRASGGFGGKWLAASAATSNAMRHFLSQVLGLGHGVVQVVRDPNDPALRRYIYRFGNVVNPRSVLESPPDLPPISLEDSAGNGRAVYLSGTVRAGRRSAPASIVGVRDDSLRVRVRRGLPKSFQRVEVHLLLDSSNGMLPIAFQGSVSFTRPSDDEGEAGDFVLKITQVDEFGRRGLFQQYLQYLEAAA